MIKTRAKMFDIEKFRSVLKEDFEHNLFDRNQFHKEEGAVLKLANDLEAFLIVRKNGPLTDLIRNTLLKVKSAPEFEFAEIMTKGYTTKFRRGRRSPWNEHLGLVIAALHLATGNKDLLHQIRVTLQTKMSTSVPPHEESIYNWSRKLPKWVIEHLPSFRSVEVKKERDGTDWANEMKYAYMKVYAKRAEAECIAKIKRKGSHVGLNKSPLGTKEIEDLIIKKYAPKFLL